MPLHKLIKPTRHTHILYWCITILKRIRRKIGICACIDWEGPSSWVFIIKARHRYIIYLSLFRPFSFRRICNSITVMLHRRPFRFDFFPQKNTIQNIYTYMSLREHIVKIIIKKKSMFLKRTTAYTVLCRIACYYMIL